MGFDMNTNQDDINKAAKKIILGMERVHRFIDNYNSHLTEEDKFVLRQLTNELNRKLNE
jgi:hypothetical protein